ncbi:3-oxoacyl-[acyl-carrier protein] reductase [Panacagrimonas perspica]|uniref:3-oxoacyl-[acyl-carrier protein] reductase n=2 Tax=Panacagrimonas perspica TaxID=381431 RepID=A0A4R7PF54_9GAMM|nr:3-oxoacyl-[acyl-carrier protein] reductase [Panacagrimonas perspica]THD05190.1 hypothetical protein B1810_00040 [Panacagrimonas perspica]
MSLEGKVAIVTGGAGEIGAAAVRRLVAMGARVAIFDRDPDALKTMAAELGDKVSTHTCDVTDEAGMKSAIDAAAAHHGRLDIGVLNAGIPHERKPIQDLDMAVFDKVMAVNVRGVMLGLKYLFPHLKKVGGGSIVITASTESLRGNEGIVGYTASKHAVVGLCKTAALEWARHNIRVNCVNPGPCDTPLLRSVEEIMTKKGVANVREKSVAIIPMKRLARTEEVANFIGFLASDQASYSTGGTYLLDGGMLAGKQALEGQ